MTCLIHATALLVREDDRIICAKRLSYDVPVWSMLGGRNWDGGETYEGCAKRHVRNVFNIDIHARDLKPLRDYKRHHHKGTKREVIVRTQIFGLSVPKGTVAGSTERARKELKLLLQLTERDRLPALTPFLKHHYWFLKNLHIWPEGAKQAA